MNNKDKNFIKDTASYLDVLNLAKDPLASIVSVISIITFYSIVAAFTINYFSLSSYPVWVTELIGYNDLGSSFVFAIVLGVMPAIPFIIFLDVFGILFRHIFGNDRIVDSDAFRIIYAWYLHPLLAALYMILDSSGIMDSDRYTPIIITSLIYSISIHICIRCYFMNIKSRLFCSVVTFFVVSGAYFLALGNIKLRYDFLDSGRIINFTLDGSERCYTSILVKSTPQGYVMTNKNLVFL